MHEFKLAAGSDDRCRTTIWPFSTITGRMAPNGSSYPFTTAAWTRYLITPAPGTALAYLDFASMEFGVAAGLSRCPAMVADYTHGDPYLGSASPPGWLPQTRRRARMARSATGSSRWFWPSNTAAAAASSRTGCGSIGEPVIARRAAPSQIRPVLGMVGSPALRGLRRWRADHPRRLAMPGDFAHLRVQRAQLADPGQFRGIFRYAGLMARKLGIKVCAVVHDALLIEAPADRIDEEAARATLCLERASRMFLHDVVLRVDTKIIREGERFADKRGAKIWDYVERTLKELPEEPRDAA